MFGFSSDLKVTDESIQSVYDIVAMALVQNLVRLASRMIPF